MATTVSPSPWNQAKVEGQDLKKFNIAESSWFQVAQERGFGDAHDASEASVVEDLDLVGGISPVDPCLSSISSTLSTTALYTNLLVFKERSSSPQTGLHRTPKAPPSSLYLR